MGNAPACCQPFKCPRWRTGTLGRCKRDVYTVCVWGVFPRWQADISLVQQQELSTCPEWKSLDHLAGWRLVQESGIILAQHISNFCCLHSNLSQNYDNIYIEQISISPVSFAWDCVVDFMSTTMCDCFPKCLLCGTCILQQLESQLESTRAKHFTTKTLGLAEALVRNCSSHSHSISPLTPSVLCSCEE